ncbi:hypothetical protein [Microbacterium arborescens]|uniref:hypothetical protein n=1 Tax=Microbacterium arborescens TaxID=33883 RepID=UPI003C71F130
MSVTKGLLVRSEALPGKEDEVQELTSTFSEEACWMKSTVFAMLWLTSPGEASA